MRLAPRHRRNDQLRGYGAAMFDGQRAADTLAEAETALRDGNAKLAEATYLRTLGKLGPFADPLWRSGDAADHRTRSQCHARLAALAFDDRDFDRSLRQTAAAAAARRAAIAADECTGDDVRFMITALVHAATVHERLDQHGEAIESCVVALDFTAFAKGQDHDPPTRMAIAAAERAATRLLDELHRRDHEGGVDGDAGTGAGTDADIDDEVIDLTDSAMAAARDDDVIDLTVPEHDRFARPADRHRVRRQPTGPTPRAESEPSDRRQSGHHDTANVLVGRARAQAVLARFLLRQNDNEAAINAHRAVRTATRAREWARQDHDATPQVAVTLIDALVTRSDVLAEFGNDEIGRSDLRRARAIAEQLWLVCPSTNNAAAFVLVAARSAALEWDHDETTAVEHLKQARTIVGEAETVGVEIPPELAAFGAPLDGLVDRVELVALGDQLLDGLQAGTFDRREIRPEAAATT